MLPLPILNVRLNACHADWQQMTPTAQGHHCAQCNHTVLDFTTSTHAGLEAAFQTATDGRVCGRFRPSQLAPSPQLRPKLRRFLAALVLMCGLGLTSGAALAQVRYMPQKFSSSVWHEPIDTTGLLSKQVMPALTIDVAFSPSLVDNPPHFKGGEAALKRFLQKNLRVHPIFGRVDVEGWTRVQFIVDVDGRILKPVVYKSLYWAWDDEVLRVAKLLDYRFEPATYNGELVASSYVLSVPFFIPIGSRQLPFQTN